MCQADHRANSLFCDSIVIEAVDLVCPEIDPVEDLLRTISNRVLAYPITQLYPMPEQTVLGLEDPMSYVKKQTDQPVSTPEIVNVKEYAFTTDLHQGNSETGSARLALATH